MENSRPTEVKRRHLTRRAVVYVRQSSGEQVAINTGSTAYQRGQVRYPNAWGWPEEFIDVVDEDLGLSGTAAEHRHGYQRIVGGIKKNEIGALFMSDLTRGGRNAAEWFRLLDTCRDHDVLIVVDGKVYDPNDSGELLVTRLTATVAEHENAMRRETMRRGKIAKIEQGKHVSPPPSGYVSLPDGSWVKDPDPQVQAAVLAVFRKFLEVGTCPKTVQAMRAEGIKLPRRNKDGSIRWADASVGTLYSALRNPSYCGCYAYGRRRVDPRAGRCPRGRPRLRWVTPDEAIVKPHSHEPYLSEEEWEHVQRILKLNAPSQDRRNLGPGSALVQGIIRCNLHRGRLMTAVYKPTRADGGRSHAYNCMGDYHEGGKQCGHLPGSLVDRAVSDAMFDRLSAPSLEILRDVIETANAGAHSDHQRQKLELNRCRQEAMIIEDKFVNLDPESVEVGKGLEKRLETTRRQITKLERQVEDASRTESTFDEDAFRELEAECQDLPALLEAPTTTHQDRKQIIRTLIDRVLLEYREPECVRLRIRWADRSADTMITFMLGPHTNRLVLEMDAEGLTPEGIAVRLNESGIRTQSGRSWERHTVAQKLRRLRSKQTADSDRVSDRQEGAAESR